jgi:hypothetical protein
MWTTTSVKVRGARAESVWCVVADQKVVSLKSHRLSKPETIDDLKLVMDLLVKHGLADGLPLEIDWNGEPWLLLFGRVKNG